ncbi:MAG TPA: dTDP-4-dehydrorhamnose 3,5-epimerase [Gemmatimonadales bacterium]|nr:dTDP-4-dehydrorhamnose 3,5-epimerase [Gemmatimonadales bacterium]
MRALPTALDGVLIIEPQLFEDERGFFMEVWHLEKYRGLGIDATFVQENHSRSGLGTVRGLHYQLVRPQGKLVRAVQGSVFDVAVDLRRSSPGFGRWTGATLSAENRRMLWIPPGFAHGFAVTSPVADVVYLCTEYYAPAGDRTLQWNDPALGIPWPLEGETPLVSPKDAGGIPLDRAPVFP